jgi:hypothetical protein
MSGRLKIDDQVAGFPGLEDTEIPALQKHAMETADETRSATCRRFLTDLRNFLTSVHLQVVLSDQPTKLADDMREAELRYLEKAMDGLRKVGHMHPFVGAGIISELTCHRACPGPQFRTHTSFFCMSGGR